MSGLLDRLDALRRLSADDQVALLFVALFGALAVASAVVSLRSITRDDEEGALREKQLRRDLGALWLGALVFWVAWLSGPMGSTLAFGVISFLALREFITLAHTRRGDHRSLILAFFVVLPLQYLIVGLRRFDLFSVFIPVYVFLAIPVVSALAGDPQRFLERNAKIQWGIMVCVYGLSHAPALLLLDCRASAGAAPSCCSSWSPCGRRADRAGAGQPLALRRVRWCGRSTAASRGAPSASGSPSRRWPAPALFWITPVEPPARRHGGSGGGQRHAGRAGDAGAEEGRRRALLGQCKFGHRRRGSARPRGAAVLRGAGVLPLGALVRALRPQARHAHPRHRPRPAAHRLRRRRHRRPALAYVASGTISTWKRRAATCRCG
jgi:phosphatidate cytidylyltransferase